MLSFDPDLDSDSGIQNVADPTDPDPNQCIYWAGELIFDDYFVE